MKEADQNKQNKKQKKGRSQDMKKDRRKRQTVL
jgi:hypothetical protein